MLVPLAEIKTYLGITAGDTTQDAFLTMWGTIVSDAIEVFCRRKLLAQDIVEVMYKEDFVSTTTIKLFQYPVNGLTEVTIGDGSPTDEDVTSKCRLHKEDGFVFNKCGFFTHCEDQVTFKYNAGYTTLPSPIKMVVMSLVQEKYTRKQAGVDLNFGSDVQRISIPATISIDFDYTLQNNELNNEMGQILGSYINVLSYYQSERTIVGNGRVTYVG